MTMSGSAQPQPSQRRVRALVHLLRTPLTAARLRLRLTVQDRGPAPALTDVEAALVGLDAAVARLLPLAAGELPHLPREPADLVAIVAEVAQAAGLGGALRAPATLSGCWDRFAVACIVRNLLALAKACPGGLLALTLAPAPRGAALTLLGSAVAPHPTGARRWLIQHLARAHGGSATFSFEPGLCSAQVFLAGEDLSEV
jgi:hypothetical protein